MHTFRRHVNYSRVAYASTDIPMTYFADNAFTRVMLLLRSDQPLHMSLHNFSTRNFEENSPFKFQKFIFTPF